MWFWPENASDFGKDLFFLDITCFWAKNLWFRPEKALGFRRKPLPPWFKFCPPPPDLAKLATPLPWASGRPPAAEGPWAREGAHQMTLRNQHVKPEDLFFFGEHLISTRKIVRILVKTFLFFLEITSFFGPNWPEIRHIWAGPVPTFGPRRHCSY